MKIALNTTIATKTRTGTGHYAANLTAALMKLDHGHEFVIYCAEDMRDWFHDHCNGNNKVTVASLKFKNAFQRIFWEQAQLESDLTKHGIELLHSMAFTSPILASLKTVVTVHDLAFYHYPETIPFTKKLYYYPVFRRSIKNALRVITGSETVRQEVINTFDLYPSKVISVAESVGEEFLNVSEKFIEERHKKLGAKEPYLLTVGTLEPRKNLIMLLKAFDLFKKETNYPHKLIVSGKKGWLKKNISNKSDDVVFTGYIAQEDMPALYAKAALFMFPSLYEGFGIPLLEAFTSGVPVIASDIPVHREVCDNAAVFVHPKNIEQWKEAMILVLNDSTVQKSLKAKGYHRVKEFSWKKAAKKTLEVYRMVAKI